MERPPEELRSSQPDQDGEYETRPRDGESLRVNGFGMLEPSTQIVVCLPTRAQQLTGSSRTIFIQSIRVYPEASPNTHYNSQKHGCDHLLRAGFCAFSYLESLKLMRHWMASVESVKPVKEGKYCQIIGPESARSHGSNYDRLWVDQNHGMERRPHLSPHPSYTYGYREVQAEEDGYQPI